MIVKCDTDKIKNVTSDLTIQVERYKEIIEKLYQIVSNLESNGWSGESSKKYSKYLKDQKNSYIAVYNKMDQFGDVLKQNLLELESAIQKSKVSKYDKD